MKQHKKSLFIFRRDFRLEDNTALINALENSEEVICSFIFESALSKKLQERENLAQFMINSLKDLEKDIESKGGKLYFFEGESVKVIRKLKEEIDIDSIYINKDYTPFSIKRDKEIEKICEELEITFNSFDDLLLNPPIKIHKDNGEPYTIFTPYYKKAIQYEVKQPIKNLYKNFFNNEISFSINIKQPQNLNKNLALKGGRSEAIKLLNNFLKRIKTYGEKRDFPKEEATSMLSPHNKFGTLSPRETYYKIKENTDLGESFIRQLYWRDFFTQIAYNFPHVFTKSFNKKYNDVFWENDKEKFKLWCEGKTGFPIIDAAMRELNSTGYMHNRCRMIVASFLTKDLHIDWRLGEKYFAKKLIDYDPCVNNGSWQWAASTGCDAQPYFRIFNPWLQQKKFDENAEYIKKWIPELRNLDPKTIHSLEKCRPLMINSKYPKPIVIHQAEKNLAIKYFKEI